MPKQAIAYCLFSILWSNISAQMARDQTEMYVRSLSLNIQKPLQKSD